MPIKIHDNLPARKLLKDEIVDVIDSSTAEKQDIRPLKFLLLNLMPKKRSEEGFRAPDADWRSVFRDVAGTPGRIYIGEISRMLVFKVLGKMYFRF